MKIISRKKPGPEGMELNITAMVNVVFLLLTYLVITAKPITVYSALDAARPQTQEPTPPPPAIPMVEVMVFEDAYTVCGKRVNTDGLGNALHQLAKMDRTQTVIIKCAEDSAHENLVAALNLCAKAELSNISVLSM